MVFFRKKGKLRKDFDEKLVNKLHDYKEIYLNQVELVERSVDPPEDLLIHVKLYQAKYYFLLKEAKARNVLITKMK
ncbi:YaaL family protein [Bacillus sp. EAC]|uniref:YaaL family protein n=1 Tax=Bacillus sp. EAC TaxID=1978338 RepID=UPI000B454A43|nr:YaaL family protein [Bacillus sp. EAC]